MIERIGYLKTAAAIAATAALAACGGGGATGGETALNELAAQQGRGGSPNAAHANANGHASRGAPGEQGNGNGNGNNNGNGNGNGNGGGDGQAGEDPAPPLRMNLGDDFYDIQDNANFVINEFPDGGIDTVGTWVGYTLPPNVENLTVTYSNLMDDVPLVGNGLDNVIHVAARGAYEVFGMAGDDTLVQLAPSTNGSFVSFDGGEGADTLVMWHGHFTGGPGADTFFYPRDFNIGALDPGVHITDFNAAEGDRIRLLVDAPLSELTVSQGITENTFVIDWPGTAHTREMVVRLDGITTWDWRYLELLPKP